MGTPTNLLPNSLYFAIGKLYPDATQHIHRLGFPAYKVPCDAPFGTFDYIFGNQTIKVPFLDSLYKDGDNCTSGFTLGPQDTGQIPLILGDASIRGVYMAFDLDNDEIWIGETADCGSNVVPIGKGEDAVPIISGCEESINPTPLSSVYGRCPVPTSLKQEGYAYEYVASVRQAGERR
jgi:hypothetical protein